MKRMIKNDIKRSSGGTESSFSLGVVATVFVEMDFWCLSKLGNLEWAFYQSRMIFRYEYHQYHSNYSELN